MAHNITERDGMFTVREAAWHGLGKVLSDYPTRAEAQRIAHPWEPVQEPVYRRVLHPDFTETYEEVSGEVLNVRSDTGESLGVVHDTYTPVTNTEMYDIAEAIEGGDTGSVRFETGGSLKGGRKVWLLLRLNEPLTLPGDPNGATIPYYALQNAHDGSGAFRGQATMTRIVCDNTAQMADLDAAARGTEFVFRHSVNVGQRIQEAKEALGRWRTAITVWRDASQRLVDLRLSPEQVERFVTEFIPEPAPHLSSDRVMSNIEAARVELRTIIHGPTCAEISRTGWGMVQASIEYAEHFRKAKNEESRFKRAYLDNSALTSDAVDLVYAIAR